MTAPSLVPEEAAVATFVEGFRDRVRASAKPGQQLIDEPGIVALLGTSPELLDGRVLITDDRALDVVGARQPEFLARVVNVFAAAEGCAALVMGDAGYRSEPATAMVQPRLAAVDGVGLPSGLTLRTVGVEPGEMAPGEVSLEEAAAAALRSDPAAAPVFELDGFVAYLRSVPQAHYVAATDEDGRVRATAAAAVFGATTSVYFVNTDPGWRRRGVGTAITAAALQRAAAHGASRAVLDASAPGRPIYERLGFVVASQSTLFVRGA